VGEEGSREGDGGGTGREGGGAEREEEKRRKDKVGTEGTNVTKLTLPCMLCQYIPSQT